MRWDTYNRLWQAMKKWISKIMRDEDSDDDPFNHPYVIL